MDNRIDMITYKDRWVFLCSLDEEDSLIYAKINGKGYYGLYRGINADKIEDGAKASICVEDTDGTFEIEGQLEKSDEHEYRLVLGREVELFSVEGSLANEINKAHMAFAGKEEKE